MSPFDCLVLAHFLAWSYCSLELLDLQSCSLTHHCLEIMHQVCSEHCGTTLIEVVNLSRNHLDPTTTLSFISRIPVFEHTKKLMLHDLLYPEKVSPDHIELHCLQHLSTLDISVKNIPDSSRVRYSLSLATLVIALGNCKLQVLRFQDGSIDGQNAVNLFKSLEHSTSLEELDLSENSQLADGDSEAVGCAIESMLRVNRTLKRLHLNGCKLTDAIGKHIAIGLTNNISLVILNINSSSLSPRCAASILISPNLSEIEMGVLGVGNVKGDRTTSKLQCDVIGAISVYCVEFFRSLYHSKQMYQRLIVRSLIDQRAEHFAVGLAYNKSFQVLDLSYNSIGSAGIVNSNNVGSAGAMSIFRSLEHNTSVEELNLSENSQLAEGDSEAVSCAIERMLRVNTRLKVLNLSYCILHTAVDIHIAAGLEHSSLSELNIEGNRLITSKGWMRIFKHLHNNLSLKKLNINDCGLGDLSSAALAEMLSCNKSLIELTIGRCHIHEAGLTEIAKGLLQNTSLQTLKIDDRTPPHRKTFLEAEIERLKTSRK